MTLDEAIKERQKVIEVQEKLYKEASTNESKEIIKSATDNDRQFVEWLRELKDLCEENKVLTRDCLRLIKANNKLRKRLKQITEYKRLLKAAMEDMKILYESGKDEGCVGIEFKWRYADEAEKLIKS